ncbi:biotin/lipoyl-containing protein [Bacteroidota bacterium]
MSKDKLNIDYTIYETNLTKKFENRKMYAPVNPNMIRAFIPGVIKDVYIKIGQKVREGDKMFILEAMKMQNSVYAPMDGKIKDISITSEQRVAKNELLVEFE